jgi:hypothetical protein
MPKLYEYFGLIILFYSHEHEPIHVHCKFQGKESKAELKFENGKFVEVRISNVPGNAIGYSKPKKIQKIS